MVSHSCWTDSFTDILSGCNNINVSICFSLVVLFSYLGYLVLKKVANILWYHFMSSVEITGSIKGCNDARTYLLQWLQHNAETKRLPHVNIVSNSRREDYGQTITELNNNPSFATINYFTYKGHWVFINRQYIQNVMAYNISLESITLSTLRSHSWILEEIMEGVRLLFNQKSISDGKTRFYFAHEGKWIISGPGKRKRPLSSVILNENVLAKIIGDVHEFLGAAKWYQHRGISYRRGYLLYGPPGCGKSSFVKAVAGEIDYNICILSLTSKKLNDDTLNNLMNSTPEKSIILLEDIDAAFPNREAVDDEEENMKSDKIKKHRTIETSENGSGIVTLRGLLNALDGVASSEGRIIFLTTNYIDRLDLAMTRPGRVDLKVLIDFPDDDQLCKMFSRFYPDADDDTDAKEFVRKIRTLKMPNVSMAMIQGHFMMHKYNYKEMMIGIEQYFEEQFFSLNRNSHKIFEI